MKWLLLTSLLFFNGCALLTPSPEQIRAKAESDRVQKLSVTEAANKLTSGGRVTQIVKSSGSTFNLLVLLMVGGLAFWGITKSSWGWIPPMACVLGMVAIHAFAKYSELISLVGIGVVLFVIIWKAREYQKERNAK